MPRRALRKIDPSLDLAKWYTTVEELTAPWEQSSLFARPAPLEVELGSGKGLFLTSAASMRPEHNFLGLEVARKYALHTAARCARRDLSNAVMAQGDGLRFFHEFAADNSLEAIHVYFPDPWWKARHHKRRVMNERFLADAERTLRPGGALHFWTDVEEYFIASLELIASRGKFIGPLEVPELSPQHDLDYRTHFERRMRMHGKPVYRSEFRKPE